MLEHENKAEAEKIAREVSNKIRSIVCLYDHEQMRVLREFIPATYFERLITQALLDFREKDVRELVEALEPFAECASHGWVQSIPPGSTGSVFSLHNPDRFITTDQIRKAAALVRKFKGGKEV